MGAFCSVDFSGRFLAFAPAPALASGFLPARMLPQLPRSFSEQLPAASCLRSECDPLPWPCIPVAGAAALMTPGLLYSHPLASRLPGGASQQTMQPSLPQGGL